MLVSPTRPITPESSWVPCRLPKPTRHPIGFFFPLPYTQVPLYSNGFFSPFAVYTNTARSVPFFSTTPRLT